MREEQHEHGTAQYNHRLLTFPHSSNALPPPLASDSSLSDGRRRGAASDEAVNLKFATSPAELCRIAGANSGAAGGSRVLSGVAENAAAEALLPIFDAPVGVGTAVRGTLLERHGVGSCTVEAILLKSTGGTSVIIAALPSVVADDCRGKGCNR